VDVSVETRKEAMSRISTALYVVAFSICWDLSPLLWVPQDRSWLWLFLTAAAITIPCDSPAPAFWHYFVHLFLQAGAPAQTLPSSVTAGSLPGERGWRGQAAHRIPAVDRAEEQSECKPQEPTTLWGGCTRQPGLSPGAFRGWAAVSCARRMSWFLAGPV